MYKSHAFIFNNFNRPILKDDIQFVKSNLDAKNTWHIELLVNMEWKQICTSQLNQKYIVDSSQLSFNNICNYCSSHRYKLIDRYAKENIKFILNLLLEYFNKYCRIKDGLKTFIFLKENELEQTEDVYNYLKNETPEEQYYDFE